jgi:DNA-binding CsgD family transcriptional regulator
MKNWQEDLVSALDGLHTVNAVFGKVQSAAHQLGFEYCAYGMRMPFPLSNPRYELLNNYPSAWQARYQECNYIAIDPTVQHARRSTCPAVWTDSTFNATPCFWSEARSAGLLYGWHQSSVDRKGVAGMLTLTRSDTPITPAELADKELRMRWLVQVAHQAVSSRLAPTPPLDDERRLTEREVEVLQWTADGLTSGQISDILDISENTVNFHVKNAVMKLQSPNRTAAVVRAAMLGLLN